MQAEQSKLGHQVGTTLVLGGNGKTGRRVVERLMQRGVATRIGSRSATPAFDWAQADGWDAVLSGVSSVYITYAPDLAVPGASEAITLFVQRAKQRGVRKLVLLSGRGEDEAQACERIVQSSGLDWTIVRASWFMQNFSEGAFVDMVQAGVITLPAAEIPEPFVDADDIADVVVAALTESHHGGEVYEVTGPRAITFTELARLISEATARPVVFQRIPGEALAEALRAAETPDDVIWLLNYLFETVLDGRNVQVCDGVRRALGRPATDFTEFARRAAAEGVWPIGTKEQAA